MGLEIKMKLKLCRDKFMSAFFLKLQINFPSRYIALSENILDRKVPASYVYRGQMVPIFPPICFLLGVKIIVFTISLLFYILCFYTFRCCGGGDNGRV